MKTLLKVFLFLLPLSAAAMNLECKFKGGPVQGVKSIRITQDSLMINSRLEIPLEKTQVRCMNFGKQTRLDGQALGYQVILNSCTSEASFKGALIDLVNLVAATVLCNKVVEGE